MRIFLYIALQTAKGFAGSILEKRLPAKIKPLIKSFLTVTSHAQTQEALKILERNSSDEIEALKARISTMEENEKKRQEDDFNKKVSIWGWVSTLVLAGIPYLLLIVAIEIVKTQFSNISWRSAYGIAGAVIATAIAGVLFAVGKKCCFKKVRSKLEKRMKQ